MNVAVRLACVFFLLCGTTGSARGGDGVDFAQKWFEVGAAAEKLGQIDEAKAAYVRVLEREPRHLLALVALTRLDRAAQRTDEALDWAGRFLGLWRWLDDRPAHLVEAQKELAAFALEADPQRKRADLLRRDYVTKLLKLANEQLDDYAFHSGRAMLLEAQATDPEHPELAAGLARIQKEGGNDLAVADEGGGVDPLAGVTPEWVAANDPKHVDWDKAWTLETEHYKIKTNAGYRVLKTTARAMEQVQVFYRIFHQYKTRGESIPVANVLIFKNAEEYKTLGNQPVEWAAGHWDGQNVVTYDSRSGGEGGLAGMLDTLFHEASHQFTTLAGGSGVPSWLNEGMASFFEGTNLLSNGKLDWNLVVPGRLYPLLDDLRSATPHVLADVIEGKVEDYRVNYPFGWGIVYYLYNAEDASGRLLYRPALKEYFQGYGGEKHLERFVEFFVTKPKVEGVASIQDFEKRFKEYVFALEAVDKGQVDVGRTFEERGDKQLKRGDLARAVEFYGRALERDPDHPDVLWKLAGVLEKTNATDRAAGMLRRWIAVTTPAAGEPDVNAARRAEAEARILKDDTSAKRLAELRVKFHGDALALAKDYDKAGFPRLALRTLRGPAIATPPSVEARALYFAISDRSMVSLETWRLLFDERTLSGFYGEGDSDFKVEDGVITAKVTADGDKGKEDGDAQRPATGGSDSRSKPAEKARDFVFRRLFVDAEPSGDWSLQADVKIEAGGRLGGLCFGKKKDDLFHGIALLPEGYVDLGTFGTSPKTLVRVKHALAPGWHRVTMEVAGTRLVASVDGNRVIEFEFSSRGELRGDFGLLAGLGQAKFKEIKLLEFDPNLPRRTAIGRRKAVSDAVAEASAPLARAENGLVAFREGAPPLLHVAEWIGAKPEHGADLEQMRGWPLVLAFWTTDQERQVPLLPALQKLAETHAGLQIPIVLVSNEPGEKVREYVKANPVAFPIAIDDQHKTYGDYAISKVQLPHVKLIGADGRVVWEGNPDYKSEFGSYLDEPMAELVAKSRLKELLDATPALERADEAFRRGNFKAAADEWRKVAAIETPNERVLRAKRGLARIEDESRARLEKAEALAKEKRVLQAAKVYEEASTALAGFELGDTAKQALAALVKSKLYVMAKGIDNLLKSAEKNVAAKKFDEARATLERVTSKLTADSDPSLQERVDVLTAQMAR
ncbi:MAG: tetratricopeptide repeat protein [Planctomycetota bacterium]|nr:tetratricopeptide repeat protein [Planctomycetota bacterium]